MLVPEITTTSTAHGTPSMKPLLHGLPQLLPPRHPQPLHGAFSSLPLRGTALGAERYPEPQQWERVHNLV